MGEVNLCSDQGREVVLQDEEEEREILKETKEGSTTGIKWERSLPRMILRVLLVEADDSTRQIITALLRKCSYRVTAVPDGLKAWEALKGRPHNIDLILTEMELPLISGLALLTLIMEHEICKNIPVIMMSSHDSINLVFKCMLRGAADFFIKPIRKNELRNLWQHVWRRQSSAGSGQGFHDKTLAQRKVEAISENNAASYHSSDYVACTQKNKECSEKGSDAQSSCTKPDMEAESARMQNVEDHFQPKCWSSLVSDRKIQKHKEHVRLDQELLMHEGEGEDKSLNLRSEGASWNEANDSARLIPGEDHAYGKIMTHCEDVSPEGHREDANIYSGNYEQAGPSREAIDLIGAFDNRPRCIYRHADKTAIQEVLSTDSKIRFVSNSKLGSTPLLDLSLKRSHPSDFESQGTEERHTLNHSNASAFSWYINRTVQPLLPTPASLCTGPEETKKCHKHMPNQDPGNTADAPPHNGTDLLNQESVQDETVLPCRWLRVVPVPVPVSGIRFDDLCASYCTVLPPMSASQSGQLSLWGQNSGSQPEPTFHLNSSHNSNPETRYSEVHHLHDQNADNFTNQTVHEQMEHNLESLEDPRDVSPVNGQSVNSNLCNGAISHLNSSWCGSVCNGSSGKENVTPSAATRATAESGNVEGLIVRDGIRGMGPHCSTQREAALTKFRLKRKDRSYEKKVRYQNRKRLAEQRPRVKGQFVRQI